MTGNGVEGVDSDRFKRKYTLHKMRRHNRTPYLKKQFFSKRNIITESKFDFSFELFYILLLVGKRVSITIYTMCVCLPVAAIRGVQGEQHSPNWNQWKKLHIKKNNQEKISFERHFLLNICTYFLKLSYDKQMSIWLVNKHPQPAATGLGM